MKVRNAGTGYSAALRSLCAILSLLIVVANSDLAPAQSESLAEQLTAFGAAYQKAFNDRDLAAAEKLWGENAEYVDEVAGLRLKGRAQILESYAALFKGADPGKVVIEIDSSRPVTKDVLTIEGVSTLTHGDEVTSSRFLATLIKTGDAWQLDHVREIPLAPLETQHPELKKLNWLVGEWQEETDSHSVMTMIHWSSSRTFLIRSYTALENDELDVEGTQIIAWDPREQRIRSWSFDSTGAFGEEQWKEVGGKWQIELSRTLPDGSLAKATQTWQEVEPGVAEVSTTEIEVDGVKAENPGPTRVYRVSDLPVAAPDEQPGEQPGTQPAPGR